MLDESTIKAAVIDRLFETGMLDDAVLINEMVYANWSRRADLAVANGHLHAFEIKSDFDSLKRLDGQIAIYLERFDKVTLVVSPKFVDDVIEMTPSRVAVWEATEKDGLVQLKVVRVGKKENVESSEVLVDYLLKHELYQFLCARGLSVQANQPKSDLVKLAKAQPLSRLRAYVLESLKKRYRESFEVFASTRNGTTSPNDLSALRKSKVEKMVVPRKAKLSRRSDDGLVKVRLDLSRLFPNGAGSSNVPEFILVRNKVPRRR